MSDRPLQELGRLLPDGAEFLDAIAKPFRRAGRAHPRRGRPEQWREMAPVAWSAHGFFHAAEQDPGSNLDYHTGSVYPQDAASQLPVVLLDPRSGEIVVDACAAPGSKSTQIGLALGDDGLVVCCDRSQPRRRVLIENLERQGVACAVVTPMAPEALAERHPGAADAVLLDAPCSGHEERSAKQIARMAERQLALLESVSVLVRAGGRLVYSTCTPYRAEDEDVVARFLGAHAEWSIERVAVAGVDGDLADAGGARLWPQRQGTEPFFACRLRRAGAGEAAGFRGKDPTPSRDLARWLPDARLTAWRRGNVLLAASPQAASCALPSEARGLLVASGGQLTPWGAQALIERRAEAISVPRQHALTLWAGSAALELPAGTLLRTESGAPLGVVDAAGRLDLPSRLRRADLV